MMWGKVLHPGESLTEIVEHEIHLSMASIECRPRMIDTMKGHTAHVVLKTGSGEYLLCSLGYGLTPQQNLDLVFQPHEQISFIVEGTGVVYLTGYTIPQTESVSCYGDGGFDEATVEDGRTFPEEDNDFSQEWESEPLDEDEIITVKTEDEPPKEECQEIRHTENAILAEDPRPGGMVAIYDTINNKNETTLRSASMDLSSHEVAVVANIENVGNGEDDDGDGDVEGHGTNEWSEEKIAVADTTQTSNEAAIIHLNQSSHKTTQKCETCSNIIPLSGQLDNLDRQLAYRVPSHCQTCSQQLQEDREKCQNSTKQLVLTQENNRRPHSWNALSNISQRRDGALAGFNQLEHCSIPDMRQRRANKDRLYSFYCSYCSKPFTSQAGLKVHERTHTGEKPYKCRFCPKAFTQCTNWKSHEKTHTGEKPHKCSYCEKTFIRSDAVKSHERTHTGEKPYKCQKCPRAYGQRSLLKKHELLHQNQRL